MKSQMKAADRSGAKFAVIIGSNELDAARVVVRPLARRRTLDEPVHTFPRPDLIAHLQKALS